MKSSYKALKINSLCYRDRFVKQFPLFLTELKELNLYEDFVNGKSNTDVTIDKNFYQLSLENKIFYNQRYAENFLKKVDYLKSFETFVKSYTYQNNFYINENDMYYKKFKPEIDIKLRNTDLFVNVDVSQLKKKKENYILKKKPLLSTNIKHDESKKSLENDVTYRAEDLIIKDKIFEEESENFMRAYGLKQYKDIKYDSSKDYSFHETDAKIFARKQKKERKKLRAERKQARLEEEKQKELKKKPKNPSFYDLLNIPLELRIAKYDIPLPSEEEEEVEVVEHTPIDWDAEDLKYLIIVPHIRDIKFFDGCVGFSFGMYTGNKLLPVAVSEARVGSFLGSFIFTKRLTREIHAKKNKKALKRSGRG